MGTHDRGLAGRRDHADARRRWRRHWQPRTRCRCWGWGQSIAAAHRVGPGGQVLATDIAPALLEYAAKAAADAGLGNVDTLEADGERLDVPEAAFDAAISRVGLIYFPNQQAALGSIRRALRPGGRLSAIVYSTAERNLFFAVPVGIIRRRAQLPPPAAGQPGPFSLGGPGVAEETLARAGFHDIAVEAVPSPLRLPSAAECVRFERESLERCTRCSPACRRRNARRRGPKSPRPCGVRGSRRFVGPLRDARCGQGPGRWSGLGHAQPSASPGEQSGYSAFVAIDDLVRAYDATVADIVN